LQAGVTSTALAAGRPPEQVSGMLDRHISRREGGNHNVDQESDRLKTESFRTPVTLEALGDPASYSQRVPRQ